MPVLTRLAGLPEEHPVQVLCRGRLLPFLAATPSQADGSALQRLPCQPPGVPCRHGPRAADWRRQAQAEEFARAAAAAHSRIVDTYLAAFGGLYQGLPALAADLSIGQRHGSYGLRHLTEHLERADRNGDMTALLAQEQPAPGLGSVWYAAHEQAGTLSEYRADLDRARRLAADRTDRDLRLGRPAPSLALEIRYLMIDSAIRASVPAELIARLVESGLWSPARALFYARQPADLASRARMLAVLMPAFREKERPAVIQEALTLASRVSSPYWRAWAYSVLADYLPQSTAEEAATQGLAATAAVDADDDRAELLGWFAEQLPAPLLPEAMRLAREIADEGYRVQALLSGATAT